MTRDDLTNIKIVIIGQGGVGKTSLRRSSLGEKFRTNYIQTIGSDFSFKNITVDENELGLALWDIAGQERFSTIHPLFFKGSYGAIVVYSVVDRPTYDTVESWVSEYIKISNRPNLPILIIGNKTDLVPDATEYVTEEEQKALVENLRKKHPSHEFLSFRTSALTGKDVDDAIESFAKLIMHWMERYKEEVHIIDFEKDIDKNFPGAYAIAMNQVTGPLILAGSPSLDWNSNDIMKISNSGIKLVASLDFDDVSAQSSLVSSFPWTYPAGQFYYIAFVIENEEARGRRELFVLGINTVRELEEPIHGLLGVINGFLYSAMNDFSRAINESKIDFITKHYKPFELGEEIKVVEDILLELREKVQKSVERWYNIPT